MAGIRISVLCAPETEGDRKCLLPALLFADPVKKLLRERSPLLGELLDTGAQVGTQLPPRVGEIAYVAQLGERLTVAIQGICRQKPPGARRSDLCRH